MKKTLSIVLAAVALAVAAPAMADQGKGKGKGGKGKDNSAAEYAHGKHQFSGGERDEIRGFFDSHPAERERLPPGLAKKNKIPPGWQKKIARGERIPDDVWAYRVPLPHDILIKLPPPPPGVIHVRIEDHVFKVIEKTHEVLDDLGLPHPPTPPRLPR